MATVIKRKNPSGAVVYRAQVRVRKEGYPDFSESRTFSKKVLAGEGARRMNQDTLATALGASPAAAAVTAARRAARILYLFVQITRSCWPKSISSLSAL